MSMGEQSTAVAATKAGLCAVRRARRLLIAVLASSITIVAIQLAAVGWTMLTIFTGLEILRELPPEEDFGGFGLSGVAIQISFLEISRVALPLLMLPFFIFNAASMLSVFLTLHRGKPLAKWTSPLTTIAAVLAALPMGFIYLGRYSPESPPGIFAIPLLLFAMAYLIICVGLGVYMLWMRQKLLLGLPSANGHYGALKRQRTLAALAAVAAVATAIGTVAISTQDPPQIFGFILLLPSLPSLFLLLPVAMIASDVYNMRRQVLEAGPDKRLAVVSAGTAAAAILLAFSGMLAFAAANPEYLYQYEGPGHPHFAELELCGEEYAEIRNGGPEELNLDGWVITQGDFSRPSATLEIPAGVLAPSERIRIYTQAPPADAPDGSVTFGRDAPIWGDAGDTARLAKRNEQGGTTTWHSLRSEQCTR